jgi:hypothetical protein
MSSVRLVSFVSMALVPSVALVACGGGDTADDPDAAPIVLIDSMPIDAMPAPDAIGCQLTECPETGVCTDLDTDITNCGECGNECQGGSTCDEGECTCIVDYVPANPSFGFEQLSDGGFIPGVTLGFGIYSAGGVANVMAVGYPMGDVTLGEPGYDLSTVTLGDPPLLGVSYDFDVQTQMPSNVAHFATAGTIVFDTACAEGFTGHATNVTFSGVTGGLTNPTIDPEGCSFTVESVTFAFGEPCPVE